MSALDREESCNAIQPWLDDAAAHYTEVVRSKPVSTANAVPPAVRVTTREEGEAVALKSRASEVSWLRPLGRLHRHGRIRPRQRDRGPGGAHPRVVAAHATPGSGACGGPRASRSEEHT